MAGPPPQPARPDGDPPTRRLSLADELLGGDSDETIELPVHKSRDDR